MGDAIRRSISTSKGLSTERVMTGCASLGALGVAAFAFVATWTNDGVPKINGVDHLALFAKPIVRRQDAPTAPSAPARVVLAEAKAPESGGPTGVEIDYGPTASTAPTARPTAQTDSATKPVLAPGAYRLVRATRARVRFARGREIVELQPGESAPGFGLLKAIVWRDGAWSPVFEPPSESVKPQGRRGAPPRFLATRPLFR